MLCYYFRQTASVHVFLWLLLDVSTGSDTVYLSILVRNSQTIQNHTFGAYEVDFITCKTLTETYWGTMLETWTCAAG